MPKLFNLKILTPEREFFDGDVEAVTMSAPDGKVTILADHTPFIMPVDVGTISIKMGEDGVRENAVNSLYIAFIFGSHSSWFCRARVMWE